MTKKKLNRIKTINIIAIHSGHNAGIALIKNNKLVFAISEEKFTNIKNQSGFPKLSIHYVLENYLEDNELIDKIIMSSKILLPASHHKYLESQDRKKISFKETIKNILKKTVIQFFLKDIRLKFFHKQGLKEAKKGLFDLGLQNIDLEFVDHHLSHAYSIFPIIGDKFENKKLVFTMDGSGDGVSSTVSIFDNGRLERIAFTRGSATLGGVYSQTTRFLGMKILEHEYKVMGLAAYAKDKYFMNTYNRVFKNIVWLSKNNPMTFESRFNLGYFENYLRKVAVGERFDNLSGALQYFLEDIVIKWIKESVKHTGITEIITSGGVFMNVKLNKLIQEIPELTKVDFMPSCGDESLPFGAAYKVWKEINKNKNFEPNKNIYLGINYSNKNIERFLDDNEINKKFSVEYFEDIEKKIAELLSNYKIVARIKGNTEFGARSLGNRAILGNPKDMKTFYEVNDMIKVRDFWMPFAPSILDSYAGRYLKNYDSKKNIPHFMISAYDSTEEFRLNCRAAMHQGDLTARPQVVRYDDNPDYHELIKRYYKISGRPALINTSFNHHEEPIVCSPEDAVRSFEKGNVDILFMENIMIKAF